MSAELGLLWDRLAGRLPEVPATSAWCQRWAGRRQRWQLADPGEQFDHRRYEVHPVADDVAKGYVEANHYSGSYVAALRRFGLFRAGQLVGVAVYSNPVGRAVLSNALPDCEPARESAELGRLVLADAEPGNTESWFLARCHEYLYADGFRGIVSFADPVPRRAVGGDLVVPGHVGYVYQGTNAVYTGRGTRRTHWLLPDGTVFHEASKEKIRDQDVGHDYAERILIRWGARPMRAGEDPRAWLRQARADAGVRYLRHPGCHRYVWPRIGGRRQRRPTRIGPVQRPAYPKHIDLGRS